MYDSATELEEKVIEILGHDDFDGVVYWESSNEYNVIGLDDDDTGIVDNNVDLELRTHQE